MKSVDFRNDPMFLRNQFVRDGTFEMPVIKKTKLDLETIELIGYDKLNEGQTDKIVHFFLDDYKFEILWKDPEPRIEKLKEYRAILSPQFSMYTEMPVAVQIYQVFKSRWCGAYFQSKGLKVIPSLVWGEADTFWFSFDGVNEGSVVAVSTVGMRTEKQLFLAGYKEMLRRIKPKAIICYGDPFEEMEGKLIVIDYAKTNNLTQEKALDKPIVKYIQCLVEKGGGSAGGGGETALPIRAKSNSKRSLFKDGKLIQERIYDENGQAKTDIDYTDHGNPLKHPEVPHKHNWDWSDPEHPIRR